MQHYTVALQEGMIILGPKYLGKALAKLSYLDNTWNETNEKAPYIRYHAII